jgi:hypothetical protein
MQVGSRVVFLNSKGLRLGSVIKEVNNLFYVSFDSNPFNHNNLVPLPANVLQEVNYWITKRVRDPSQLKYTDKPPLDLFLQKGTKRFDIIAARAMWGWVNLHLFNSALKIYPTFTNKLSDIDPIVRKKFKNATGLCVYMGNKNTITIYLNPKSLVNLNSFWNTLVHETIHQYNFEHGLDDGHGPNFIKWKGAVKSICHTNLDVTHDLRNDDYDIEDGEIVDADKVPEYYILVIRQKSVYVGIASADIKVIQRIKSDLGAQYTTYIRKANSAQLKQYLNLIKTDRITLNKKTKILPSELAQQLINSDNYKLYSNSVVKVAC